MSTLSASSALPRELRALVGALPITLFVRSLRERVTPDPADAALRARVLARLAHEPGWQAEESNAVVLDGTVILQGLFGRDAERRATRALVQRQSGVRAVRDDRVRAREWQSLG